LTFTNVSVIIYLH